MKAGRTSYNKTTFSSSRVQGDATYLIVKDGKIRDFGLNAVCTHLGCVVPRNKVCVCTATHLSSGSCLERGKILLRL